MPQTFNKVLIANRGEIALRVMRSCREMGIRTVAVYSDADRTAPHVLMADEAYHIGASPARESYLLGDRIIETALKCNADAIHPGYGFLAENGDFAESVESAGLTFIGPPADSIRAMGSKTEARRIMSEAGVPVVPGDKTSLDNSEDALKSAEKIGYPVLIKAAYGGGGKGMRVVRTTDELPAAFDGARRESLSAFGSDEVYLERFIEGPRHIEIQVLADKFGHCIHLYERECSIQRRHQKVIEEAPSPALVQYPEIRERMGEAAVAATRACGYVNAGTVEFLFDPATNDFFFLEMNTRLQVEHPVTEMVTGIDLVRAQLLIAMGEPISVKQKDIKHTGSSIECRLYAEDPAGGFLPDAGVIKNLVRPGGPWVRVDSGVEIGSEVGVYYDPLVAKLIVWGADRETAIRRMHRALGEYRVVGISTNIAFNHWAMEHPRFISGDFDTRFIEQEFSSEKLTPDDAGIELAAVIAAAMWEKEQQAAPKVDSFNVTTDNNNANGWKQSGRVQALR
ncbi:MAG: acetyl-CoA carboxylase biotin carboxylase subunit [Candidatus Hatepunaea meridiana]|nr:acetyl-CoA carboxylase biotin carboxylase subunit [Candidatus Hatepunaea meridiana]